MTKNRSNSEFSLFIGSQCTFNGALNFSGSARIDGAYTGDVKGDGVLFIGPHAIVKAEIEAQTVVISGDVVGNIAATERIELKTPGKLKGNITAPLVVMDEGVLFEGHCAMAPMRHTASGPITLIAANGENLG